MAKKRKLLTIKKTSKTSVGLKGSASAKNDDASSESEEKYEIDFIVNHRVVEEEDKI